MFLPFHHITRTHTHTRRAAEACAPSSGRRISAHVCLFQRFSFFSSSPCFLSPCVLRSSAWFISEERKALPAAVFVQNDGSILSWVFFTGEDIKESLGEASCRSPTLWTNQTLSSRQCSLARGKTHTEPENAQTAPRGAVTGVAVRAHVRASEVCASSPR